MKPRSQPRPEWATWAYDVARDLRTRWTWLADSPLTWVAAAVGAALGPDWTAHGLVDHVGRVRGRELLEAPARPVAYLRSLLREVLTMVDEPPPLPARLYREARDEQVRIQVLARRERDRVDRERQGRVAAVLAALPAGTCAACATTGPDVTIRPGREVPLCADCAGWVERG